MRLCGRNHLSTGSIPQGADMSGNALFVFQNKSIGLEVHSPPILAAFRCRAAGELRRECG